MFDPYILLLSVDRTRIDEEQGRIHGYPSRVRVGRGSDREGHMGRSSGVGEGTSMEVLLLGH